jgi:hypothetical protein
MSQPFFEFGGMLPIEITFTDITARGDIVAGYETNGRRMMIVSTADCNDTQIVP